MQQQHWNEFAAPDLLDRELQILPKA